MYYIVVSYCIVVLIISCQDINVYCVIMVKLHIFLSMSFLFWFWTDPLVWNQAEPHSRQDGGSLFQRLMAFRTGERHQRLQRPSQTQAA